MTRTTAVNFSGALQFPMADAGTDIFVKEDVQTLAKAVDGHDHTTGKGLTLAAGSIPNGTITSAMIADGTIVAGDIADGAVTSAKILDGTVATTDLADGAVTNAKLAADTARANLLTNGGFEIWQRGNLAFSAVPGGAGVWGPDNWNVTCGTGSALSVQRDSANSDASSQYCALVSYTHSTGFGGLNHGAGTEIWPRVRGRTITASVRIKTSVANSARIRMNDGVTGIQYSAFHSGSNQYETLTLTYAVALGATALSFLVEFNVSGAAYIDNAMLVVGSVAANYAPLHPADDLARCLRYYEIVGETVAEISIYGYQAAGGATGTTTPLKVRKAVVPTVTKNGTWGTVNNGQPIVAGSGVGFISWYTIAVAAGQVNSSNTGAGSNFTAESNP